MDTPLKELKEKAVVEITNKMVNNMTMSEVTEVVIRYSEQTARKVVKELDRERLEHIVIGKVSIDKEVKRKPIKKHSGWNDKKPEKREAVPKKKPEKSWLNLFGEEKARHSGWNSKGESLLLKIKNFFKSK
jgi:hypothetical protein